MAIVFFPSTLFFGLFSLFLYLTSKTPEFSSTEFRFFYFSLFSFPQVCAYGPKTIFPLRKFANPEELFSLSFFSGTLNPDAPATLYTSPCCPKHKPSSDPPPPPSTRHLLPGATSLTTDLQGCLRSRIWTSISPLTTLLSGPSPFRD